MTKVSIESVDCRPLPSGIGSVFFVKANVNTPQVGGVSRDQKFNIILIYRGTGNCQVLTIQKIDSFVKNGNINLLGVILKEALVAISEKTMGSYNRIILYGDVTEYLYQKYIKDKYKSLITKSPYVSTNRSRMRIIQFKIEDFIKECTR